MKNIILLVLVLASFIPLTAQGAVGPLINGNQINPQTAISIATMTVTGAAGLSVTKAITASSMTLTGVNGILLPSDVPISWGGTSNQINADSTRLNVILNSVNSMSVTPTAVGILTFSPGAALDVQGNAQFGTTAKSTFSTTGALTLPNDIGVQWGSSINNINGDGTRINLNVNNTQSMSVTPTATIVPGSSTASAFFGNIGQTTGNAQTASALAATPSAAASGFVCRGIDASGNCLAAAVNATTSGVSSSTSPWSAGAAFTTDALNAKLGGATFTGAVGLTNVALTATGASGNIVSASSITTTGGLFGNSLSVGGTTINGSGAITLAASQAVTLSGANGNVVSASSITTTGGFFGKSGGLSNLIYSTAAIPSGYTVTQSTFKDCITGSTVTITMPVAGVVLVGFSGSASNGTATNGMGSMIEVDGGFPTGLSATSNSVVCESTLSSSYCPLPITVLIPLASGTHNFCASLKSVGGTNTISLQDTSIIYAVMIH